MGTIILENIKYSDRSANRLDIPHCRLGGTEATVICGPACAGKTLLLRLAAGLLPPSQGNVHQEPEGKPGPGPRSLSFFMPDPDPLCWAGTSLADEFHLLARCRGLESWTSISPADRQSALEKLLADWGLPPDHRRDPAALSRSEQYLLGLALSEFSQAGIVLLDGYPGVLDLAGTRRFIDFLGRLKAQKRAVYVASNDLERFLAHMDRMILMKEGRIILDALPERVLPYLEAHGLRKPQLKLAEMTWQAGSR